jgi:hypothetical protein
MAFGSSGLAVRRVLRQTIRLDEQNYKIIGVMPRDFA